MRPPVSSQRLQSKAQSRRLSLAHSSGFIPVQYPYSKAMFVFTGDGGVDLKRQSGTVKDEWRGSLSLALREKPR